MKRTLFTQKLKLSLLTVPAAALMLGAAQAQTSIGINFAGGAYAYYNTGTTFYAQYACGYPVTATAFGVASGGWTTTGYGGTVGIPFTYLDSGTVVTNALNVSWSTADCWGTQIDLNSGLVDGNGYVRPTPGNNEVTWGMLDNTGWTISISGLNATFPNGYVIQGIAAGKVNSSSIMTVTDGSTFTDSLSPGLIYSAVANPSGSVGLLTSPAHTADSITMSNPTRDSSPTAFALAGFIVTDKPVVSYGPVSGSYATGSTINLSTVVAALTNNLAYQWRSNSIPILNATNSTFSKAGATMADSANYDVIVTNLYGATTSSVAVVTVAAPVPVTWDANTGTSGAQDGSGTWDATTANWWNGTADVAWSTLNPGIFGAGTPGAYTVTLATSVTVGGGLTFNTATYTITNNSGASLTLAGAVPITANANAILKVPLTGGGSLTKNGTGTLTLGNLETYTAGTVVNAGTVNLTYNGGASGTIQDGLTINTNATVICTVNNSLGYSGANWVQHITLNYGTLDSATASDNGWGTTINMTGGTLGTTVAGGYFSMGQSPVFNVTGASVPSVISADLTVRDGANGIMFNVTHGTAATDLTISGNLRTASSGGITINGSGIVQFSGPNNTYTGNTTINGGTLIVSGPHATGSGAGSVTLADNVALIVYANGSAITVTNGNSLNLGTGAGTNAIGFGALTSTNVAPITVNEVIANNPVTINIISLAPIIGQYPLIKCPGGAALNGGLTLGTLPAGFTATLVDDTAGPSQSVYLNVTAAPLPPTLVWTGSISGAWDINTTANWTSNGIASKYQDPDFTIFDDTATTTAITLNTTVSPTSVTFSNATKNYSISGTGSISGFAGLTKNNNAILSLSNTNTYTGETVINGGTLQLNDAPLSTSDITNASALVYSNLTAQSVAYSITGTGTLTKTGTGTLTLTANLPLSGGVTVNGGTLRVTAGNFAGRFTPSIITINTNATLLSDNYHALGGNTTGLIINHGTWLMNYEDYKQSITMMDGLIATGGGGDGGDLRIGFAGGAGNYTLLVTNSVAGSVISEKVNTITTGNNWIINAARGAAASDLTISGVINNAGNIIKSGNGIVTLTASNTYTGTTTINAGTLAVTGLGTITNSPVITIGGGAVLDVTGLPTLTLPAVEIISNSTSTALIRGSVDASLGDLELTYGGTPAIAVGNGTLTLSSGTVLNINNTGSPLANGNYKLLATNTAGLVSGTLPASFNVTGNGLASGATASLSSINNEVYLAVVGGVNTNPSVLTNSVSGNVLTLSWPTDHLGWRLQVQTNSLSVGITNNWFDWPNSTSVTTVPVTINPGNPAVFFRLVYP